MTGGGTGGGGACARSDVVGSEVGLEASLAIRVGAELISGCSTITEGCCFIISVGFSVGSSS